MPSKNFTEKKYANSKKGIRAPQLASVSEEEIKANLKKGNIDVLWVLVPIFYGHSVDAVYISTRPAFL